MWRYSVQLRLHTQCSAVAVILKTGPSLKHAEYIIAVGQHNSYLTKTQNKLEKTELLYHFKIDGF